MPRPKLSAYQQQKEMVLGAYLTKPLSIIRASQLPEDNPRFPMYYVDGKYYLLYRSGELPRLKDYTFERKFVAHGAPWTVYHITRYPAHRHSVVQNRAKYLMERLRSGADPDTMTAEENKVAIRECFRILQATEKRTEDLLSQMRKERETICESLANTNQTQEELMELRRQVGANRDEYVEELKARVQAAEQRASQRESNNLEETTSLQKELTKVRAQLAETLADALRLQERCNTQANEIMALHGGVRQRAAPPPLAAPALDPTDPANTPDEEWI